MQEYQQRVVNEESELTDKLNKLTAFFETDRYKALHDAEQERMYRQSQHMSKYRDVLLERIQAFET